MGVVREDDHLEGQKTTAMEAVSLIEAERLIAQQARESAEAQLQVEASTPPVSEPLPSGPLPSEPLPSAPAPMTVERAPSPIASPSSPPAIAEPSSARPLEHRRRFIATIVVAVLMIAALALVSVGLSRRGVSLPAPVTKTLKS